MAMDQDNDGLLKVEEIIKRLKEVHHKNELDFFVEDAETGKKKYLEFKDVEAQIKENIG